MHICFLTSDFHSHSSGGGVASYISTMADALALRGHKVTVVSLGQASDCSVSNYRVVQVARPNLHWYLYRLLPTANDWALPVRELEWSFRAWSKVVQLHDEDPIDVVETGEQMILRDLVCGEKPPLIVRGHGNRLSVKHFSGVPIGKGDRLGRKLEIIGMRKAPALTAVSEFQAMQMRQDLGTPVPRIEVIPNPILPALLSAASSSRRVTDNTPLVLYTGRLEYRKGTLVLLKAVKNVINQFPKAIFGLVGGYHNSISPQEVDKLLDEDGIRSNIELVGHVPWNNLSSWYHRASVFVMPSYYETFGISVIEAMAFGLPVVASRTGGLIEVVEDGVTGLLVPPGDSAALSEGIVWLLRNPETAQRMGQAGRERVLAEYTVERIVDQTLHVYRQVATN